MMKIYRYNVSHNNKKLNHVTSNDNDVQRMLDLVYEEGDLLNENDDDNGESILNELVEEESSQIIDVKLGIENLISLELWILINNTTLLTVTRTTYESDDNDWDPEEMINN